MILDKGAGVVGLVGGAEEAIFLIDEVCVFGHKDFTGASEVEFFGVVAEELAMDAAPDEAAIGIDIDFGDAELGGGEELGCVHAFGAGDMAAGGVDACDFAWGDGGGAVHNEGEAGHKLLDFLEDIETEFLVAGEFESAVGGTDGAGEGVDSGTFNEFGGFFGLGVDVFGGLDIFFDTLELTEFGFDDDAACVGGLDDAAGDFDIFLEGFSGGVDHDGGVDAGGDTIHTGWLIAVVEVDGEEGIGEDFTGGLHHGFEHELMGIVTGALGELDDEGGLTFDVSFEEAHRLFEVIDVVGTDGVSTVGVSEELLGGDDHEIFPLF